jgi:hypothetical protein
MNSTTSNVPYVHSLAGIVSQKKLSKRAATPYSVFCGKKLKEENNGASSIPSLKDVRHVY